MFKKDERFQRQQHSTQQQYSTTASSALDVDMSDLNSTVASSIGPSASQRGAPVAAPQRQFVAPQRHNVVTKRPRKVPWTDEESKQLLAAIKKYGRCGALIKQKYFARSSRTAQNIRDRMKYYEK